MEAADVERVFQLGADLDARLDAGLAGNGCVVSRNGRDLLCIAFDPSGRVALAKGEAPHAGGWVSECFGAKRPAVRVAWTRAASGPSIDTTLKVLP